MENKKLSKHERICFSPAKRFSPEKNSIKCIHCSSEDTMDLEEFDEMDVYEEINKEYERRNRKNVKLLLSRLYKYQSLLKEEKVVACIETIKKDISRVEKFLEQNKGRL